MSPVTWIVLIGICGFVWGGFLYFLVRGMRSEAAKSSRRTEGQSGETAGGRTEP